jgi:nucleoid DNA-binding protein
MESMTRGELERELVARTGLDPGAVRRLVREIFGTQVGEGVIAEALDQGRRVTISGFGTFSVRERDADSGPERTLAFRPGTALKERVR